MPMAPYSVKGYYRIKEKELTVPWPCEPMPDRTITLFDDDVLTKDPKTGKFMRHTGIGCFDIPLSDDQVEYCEDTANLVGV